MYAAEIVLELKEQYPQITLECAIPYERQAVRWPAALRERYFSIAERCDKETMLQRQYTRDCMKKRNQYMVDCADVVLAVWNGEPSGTGQTVWYAKRRGRLFGGLTLRLWEWSFENSEAHLLSWQVGLFVYGGAETPLSQLTLTAPLKGSLPDCGAPPQASP